MSEGMWYDLGRILSYNKIINFIVGNRGGGKSYAAKKWAINDFIKNKKQFIYLRRYNTELTDIQNYFSDIKDKYPNIEFKIEAGKFYINDEVAGFYMPLSTSQRKKSTSYPNVNKIIFDEFLIDKGRLTYMQGEVKMFLDLFETVARTRDDVRALLISNAITTQNIYFQYFNIVIRPGDKIIVRDQTVTEIYRNEEFVQFKKKTRFGQLIADTEYGDYNMNNKFILDSDTFIEKMHGQCYPWYVMIYNGVSYTVYYCHSTGYVYFTKKKAPDNISVYAITTEDHRPNLLLLGRSNTLFKRLKFAYEVGQLRFDCLQSKSAFYEIIQLI